ncbi:MAG: methyltransferase domain-containing protein [Nanoarchaeota archaeon]|nr:methyltransferase domain-containing protein [Nanoarchaeota archaeon]
MKKLHLGCGLDKRKGYINCDLSSKVNPDKIVDLEKKLPFKNNSIDEILANHVLEHVVNFIPLMHEIRRICKKGALIKIKVPFYSAWGQFNDPTHVRFFSPKTFDYFKKGTYSHEVGLEEDMFDIKHVKINFAIGRAKKLNWIMNPIINFHKDFYCRFFAWTVPSSEIEYILKVK